MKDHGDWCNGCGSRHCCPTKCAPCCSRRSAARGRHERSLRTPAQEQDRPGCQLGGQRGDRARGTPAHERPRAARRGRILDAPERLAGRGAGADRSGGGAGDLVLPLPGVVHHPRQAGLRAPAEPGRRTRAKDPQPALFHRRGAVFHRHGLARCRALRVPVRGRRPRRQRSGDRARQPRGVRQEFLSRRRTGVSRPPFQRGCRGLPVGRAGSPQGALPLRQFARSRATGGRGTLRFRVLSQPADLFRPPDPERGGRGAQAPVAVGRRDVHRSGRGEPAQPARHAADRRAAVFRVPPDQRGAPRRAAQSGKRRSAPGRYRRRGACEYSAFAAATGETAPAAVQPGSASQRPAPRQSRRRVRRNRPPGGCRERQLAARGPSATVFYWLGLLSDVAGQEQEAQDFYRKALYLEPQHAEALAHLAALLAARGDHAGARRLQQRAARGVNKDG
ncbi:putative protein methyltransferase [Pseudomonas aeruginosa VRFPA02]|nr:putative protein methyltransferase [Pseudomonas aeruginosa VRFPA02]